jgi:hypothetical protein
VAVSGEPGGMSVPGSANATERVSVSNCAGNGAGSVKSLLSEETH